MSSSKPKPIRLYLIEEQELYRQLYGLIFDSQASIELLGMSTRVETDVIHQVISYSQPDVLLLGPKKLQRSTVDCLEGIRIHNSNLGIIILLTFHETEDVKLLSKLTLKEEGGTGVLLKQSLDQPEQVYEAILAVSQGQVFLDPALLASPQMERPAHRLLRQLTNRQSEILSLLAKGYSNTAIAETLCIDVKTVEHHLNSIYTKLRTGTDLRHKHPRVSAARLYLEATVQA